MQKKKRISSAAMMTMSNEGREPTAQLQMNRLGLRNNQLKVKASGNLPSSLDESMECIYTSH